MKDSDFKAALNANKDKEVKNPDGKKKKNAHLASHQFKPGTSGNPGNRMGIGIMRAMARSCTEESLDALVSIIRHGEKDADKINAIKVILERAWGKPKEHDSEEDEKKGVYDMPMDSLEEHARTLLKGIEDSKKEMG